MTEAASMNWSREFDEPIVLPDGGELERSSMPDVISTRYLAACTNARSGKR
jgi:hypothetical protein